MNSTTSMAWWCCSQSAILQVIFGAEGRFIGKKGGRVIPGIRRRLLEHGGKNRGESETRGHVFDRVDELPHLPCKLQPLASLRGYGEILTNWEALRPCGLLFAMQGRQLRPEVRVVGPSYKGSRSFYFGVGRAFSSSSLDGSLAYPT
ncbi:hypothetical protein VNO77_19382 [Canavalia gladiata]|uniref:Uncharacterized protein n=1 Tax=Canavalia gladiata TaxID=3824 RepID=A0AAN9QLB9_CANGL